MIVVISLSHRRIVSYNHVQCITRSGDDATGSGDTTTRSGDNLTSHDFLVTVSLLRYRGAAFPEKVENFSESPVVLSFPTDAEV